MSLDNMILSGNQRIHRVISRMCEPGEFNVD